MLSIKTSSALSATHRLSQSRCSLITTDKVFCGRSCDLLQPPFSRISRNTQRPCYDAITVFDFCGTIGRAWIRTMHTRCSYACLPLSYRPPPIVCLQGLCRSVCFTTLLIAQPLVVFMWSLHTAHSEPNTAGRSRSALNRIILAAKEIQPMPNHRVWETFHFPSRANQIRTGECRSQSPVPYRLAIAL